MRADLADIRLADRVFAPHYAQAIDYAVARDTDLCDQSGQRMSGICAGEVFEVFELGRDHAWGRAVAQGLVGYVATDALRR